MIMNLITAIFGTKHERDIKKIMPLVEQINEIYPTLKDLSDTQLADKTGEFKKRLEEGETAVVVGSAAAGAAYFLAAHEADVVVVAESVPAVDAIEARAAQEALATRIQALVVLLGDWFPDVVPALAVLDPGALAALDATARIRAVGDLQERTVRGGAHLILPCEQRSDIRSLAPEALATQYPGWVIERGPKPGARWLLAQKP